MEQSNTLKIHVKTILDQVCQSHGYEHAVTVASHCMEASLLLEPKIKFLVWLAGLLHDIDDTKFFPNNKNYENARLVMKDFDKTDIDLVIEMISYVSSSKNGDTIPPRAVEFPWLLYPRYADRLEAIGWIGVVRCYKYCRTTKSPLFTDSTLKATDENDLWTRIATIDRYKNYKGSSLSFIDHFYDKLLRLSDFPTQNAYFEKIKTERKQIMIDIVMQFARTNQVDVDVIENINL